MADTISFARGAPSLDIVDVEGLKAAADARLRATTPAARPPTARRSATCRCAAGSPRSTASTPAQVIVTNGSMQADAFLFDAARRATATPVIVESPTYDRTLLGLRQRGADVRAGRARSPTASTSTRSRALLDGRRRSRRSRTSSPTSRTRPATRCRARSATALLALAARARLHDLRGRPVRRRSASAASRCRRCCRSTTATTRVVYASSFSKTVCPGIRVGYLVGPEDLIARDRQARDEHLHLARTWSPSRSSTSSARSRRDRALDRDRQGGARASASRRSPRRSSASSPRRASSRPRAATSCGSSCPRAPTSTRCSTAAAERGVQFVKGTDFLLEGGENTLRLAYSGVTPEQIDEGVARLAEALPLAVEPPRRRQPSGRSGRAPSTSCSGSATRGGGDGSAITDTVSATLARRPTTRRAVGVRRRPRRRRGSASVPSSPGSRPGRLEVVQQVLGLVLEAQDLDARADLDVGERDALDALRRRRSGGRAGRSSRRRSRRACAPRAPGDIACSRRSASSWTSSHGMPSTSVRKRSISRWRRTIALGVLAPALGERDRPCRRRA